MDCKKILSVSLLALAFAVVATGMATAKESDVLVPYAATVGGSNLASGHYDVKWETHSPASTVTFRHGHKVVATVEAKIVDRGAKYSSDAVVYREAAGGGRVIHELRFRGSSEVLVFDE